MHEWKVGDRAIAEGFARTAPNYSAYYIAKEQVSIESREHTGTVWVGLRGAKYEIHVRNLTPDRRKGERRGKWKMGTTLHGNRVEITGVFRGWEFSNRNRHPRNVDLATLTMVLLGLIAFFGAVGALFLAVADQ